MLGVKKDATAAEVKKTYFSVCVATQVPSLSRLDVSDALHSSLVNFILIRTLTKTQGKNFRIYKKPMKYVYWSIANLQPARLNRVHPQ